MTSVHIDTWDETRDRILARDEHRCTVSRLLGGTCRGILHVHHIKPRAEGGTDDDDNLATVCARHHPLWERLRQNVLRTRARHGWRRCPHGPGAHRYPGAREACERRLNGARQAA